MNSKKIRYRQTLLGLGASVGTIILVLYVIFPVGMGAAVLSPAHSIVGLPPEGFADIQLQTVDGITLSAWYKEPQNGVAIILLHGSGESRESIRPYAQLLVSHGFGVLALDMRGHGSSGGKTNRLGWQGTLDVGAAVAFLENRPEVQHIGGLGISLGGEVLLGAASAYPQMEAIAADGATRRCLNDLLVLESERPLARSYTARVMYATVRLLSGGQPPTPILASMLDAGNTRYLLIAAGRDEMEVQFNRLFTDELGARAELWIAADSDHSTALEDYPKEYEEQLVQFFSGTR